LTSVLDEIFRDHPVKGETIVAFICSFDRCACVLAIERLAFMDSDSFMEFGFQNCLDFVVGLQLPTTRLARRVARLHTGNATTYWRYNQPVDCALCLQLEADLAHLEHLYTERRDALRAKERTARTEEYRRLYIAHSNAQLSPHFSHWISGSWKIGRSAERPRWRTRVI
jgi:hypothetical protein